MKLRHYVPLIVLALLITAAAVQGLRRTPEPEHFQSQVAATANTLEDVARFELEIELREGREIEMDFQSPNRAASTATGERKTGDEALEEVGSLIEALPPLSESRPLGVIQAVLDHLGLDEENLKEFELEYELRDKVERSIDLDVDRERDDDDD